MGLITDGWWGDGGPDREPERWPAGSRPTASLVLVGGQSPLIQLQERGVYAPRWIGGRQRGEYRAHRWNAVLSWAIPIPDRYHQGHGAQPPTPGEWVPTVAGATQSLEGWACALPSGRRVTFGERPDGTNWIRVIEPVDGGWRMVPATVQRWTGQESASGAVYHWFLVDGEESANTEEPLSWEHAGLRSRPPRAGHGESLWASQPINVASTLRCWRGE